jgi:hypothetical protein
MYQRSRLSVAGATNQLREIGPGSEKSNRGPGTLLVTSCSLACPVSVEKGPAPERSRCNKIDQLAHGKDAHFCGLFWLASR